VVPPDGIPVTPLPQSYTADVDCNDGTSHDATVTFGAGGGVGSPVITGIPNGTVCKVVEKPVPAGSVVTYNPAGAPDPGVTINSQTGVTVGITNDFSGVEVQRGSLSVSKVVTSTGTLGQALLTEYNAHVSCSDGTEEDVTLPGNGGAGTPVVTGIKAGSICTVVETTVLNNNGQVTYDPLGVDTDGVVIIFDQTVAVTITNSFTGAQVGGITTQGAGAAPQTVAATPALTG
jgi:hypothetical protein